MWSHKTVSYMSRCSSKASSLLPLTESQSEQMLLSDPKSLKAKVAEKVLPSSLYPRSSRPGNFKQ